MSPGARLSAVASGAAGVPATPFGFHLFVAGLLAALGVIRTLGFAGLGGDDGEQLVFAQAFALGYGARNPPLYTWLVILAQQLFGATAAAVAAVKLALLWAMYALLYASARRVLADDRLAAAAALSPLALYVVGWDAILGLSHTVLAMTLAVAGFDVVVRLREGAHAGWSLALGAVAGLGLLAKYGFALFLVSLLAAALTDPVLRRLLLARPSLAALAVAAAIVAAPAAWLAGHWPDVAAEAAPVEPGAALLHTAKAAAGFLLPLALVLAVLFPRALRPGSGAAPTPWRRILGLQLVLAVVLFAALAAATGTRVRDHYMAVLILFPLWFLAQAQAAGVDRRRLTGFLAALVAAGPGLAGALAIKAALEPLWCEGCERHLPYDAFAAELRAKGFDRGTIVADWHPYPLAGNLKARFPESRVVSVKHPRVVPPRTGADGSCLVVWLRPDRQADVVGVANRALAAGFAADAAAEELAAPMRLTGRPVRLRFVLAAEGAGDCR